ncbi:iroquois-class homeodomain protein IRX-4 isoform X2 [Aquila chrysaetos chrysaetos]|uniref:iroquois-class homeodomain protein IRX-4 isoform X2 n=1 Tax=Aquila chrysaetos chrysaetos TaxID=223781 RepID=UPI0011772792|nr:iroquois-class homeodomain protein IRX-4 isoform X2 [Aquila chrysaetos chrysaetos]
MSYPQFGYPYSSAPQFLMSTNSLTTCCESSGRTLAETGAAASAQTPVYCPVYESRLLATARHELNSAAALGVYGGPYAGPQGYGNYVTYGTEAPAFYSLFGGEGRERLCACGHRPRGCLLPLRSHPQPVPVRQVRHDGRRDPEEKRHPGDDQHPQGLAAGAPQEPLPHQGREDHAGHHHQDDPHPGLHLVRQRPPAAQEGEQDDLAPAEQVLGREAALRGRGGGGGGGGFAGRGDEERQSRGAHGQGGEGAGAQRPGGLGRRRVGELGGRAEAAVPAPAPAPPAPAAGRRAPRQDAPAAGRRGGRRGRGGGGGGGGGAGAELLEDGGGGGVRPRGAGSPAARLRVQNVLPAGAAAAAGGETQDLVPGAHGHLPQPGRVSLLHAETAGRGVGSPRRSRSRRRLRPGRCHR